MKNTITTTAGDLAKYLNKIANGEGTIDELKEIIAGNKEFIDNLSKQGNKALLRQLLKAKQDLFVSKESVDIALEEKVITDEYAKLVKNNWDKVSSNFTGKFNIILDYLTQQGNVDGLIPVLNRAIELYNASITNDVKSTRRSSNEIMFKVKCNEKVPEHRLEETIFEHIVWDLYAIEEIKVNENTKSRFVSFVDMEKLGYKIDKEIKQINDGELSIKISVTDKNGNAATDMSLLINSVETIKQFINHVSNKLYLVNSNVIITDFSSETKMIETLYLKPFTTLLESRFDNNVSHIAPTILSVSKKIGDAILKLSRKQNGDINPLLSGFLSIVEDGQQSTVNKGEVIHRISQEEVIDKYFQNDYDKYEKLIKEDAITQTGLDRRVSILRVDFGEENGGQIDFIIDEYGIEKKQIYVPINKTALLPAQYVSKWTTQQGNRKGYSIKLEESNGDQKAFVGLPSTNFNPDVN